MTATVVDKRDAALADGLKALLCGKRNGGVRRQTGKGKQVTTRQLLHLLHRMVVVSTAIWYLATSINSCVASLKLLGGTSNAPMDFAPFTMTNILSWVGQSTIRTSPLVIELLQNDTTPRPYAVYLEANGATSTTGCKTAKFDAKLYSNYFLRAALYSLQGDAAYNITELGTYQCVVPIVDCSLTPLVWGLNTNVQVFYVMRNKVDADDVLLLSVRFSMQDYRVYETKEVGPVGLGRQHFIRDMSKPVFKTTLTAALGYPFEPAKTYVLTPPVLRDDGWRSTTVIPPNAAIAPRRVITSRRTGFFIAADTEQANILEQYSPVDTNPVSAISEWKWHGEPLVRDSWAWAHFVHAYFAFSSLVNLFLLFLVVYRNVQRGRVWFGDAFVSVSHTLFARGPVIVASWVFNGFWAVREFCLHDAHIIAGTQRMFIEESIMRADLLTLFLAITAIIGLVMRDRINPILAIVSFEIAFSNRISILKGFPVVTDKLKQVAQADIDRSVLKASESLADTSPLRLWTSRKIAPGDVTFTAACMVPYAWALFVVVLYVLVRKIYQHFNRREIYVQRSKDTAAATGTATSQNDEAIAVLYKRNLTLFEIATGVELLTSYGVMSDYENFLFIKGLKYASADGIYSSGFVIANDKFLIATADWLALVIQKLTKIRLRNVYVYVVDGNTVQQRAQLAYANTLSWNDLFRLNVTILS